MTTFQTATLPSLLLRRFVPRLYARLPQRAALPACAADGMPMLYRSEGFAEDLCDSHPARRIDRTESKRMKHGARAVKRG